MKSKVSNQDLNIVWRDASCLVLDKPRNILVHPSVDRNRTDMQCLGQAEFTRARLLHRLDFGMSKVLVFGISGIVQKTFDQADRFYLCIIAGQLMQQGLVKHSLKEKNC